MRAEVSRPIDVGRLQLILFPSAILFMFLVIVANVFVDRIELIFIGLIAFAFFVVLTIYQPLPAILLIMFLSTEGLKFVDLAYLPYVQLAQGARLNAQDLLVLVLFGLGVLRLHRRKERPLFLFPLLLFTIGIFVSFALGLVGGTTDPNSGFNSIRGLSGYLFYVALVGVIDSPRRLRALLLVLFALVLVSVAIQLVEFRRQERFTLPTSVVSEYYSTTKLVEVGGQATPYLWNRATGYLFTSLLLAAGGALWTRSTRHAILAGLALLAIVAALIRQWYVLVALGIVAMLLLPRRGRSQTILALLAFALPLAGLLYLLSAAGFLTSIPLLDLLAARLETLVNFEQEPHFVDRVLLWQDQLSIFSQSPIFGFGPGGPRFLGLNQILGLGDTGMPNTLIQYGIFGLSAILFLIGSFLRQALALFRRLPVSLEQGYVAGLIGAWIGGVAGYSFGLDFFTSSELVFAVGVILALVDRFNAFSSRVPLGDA